MVMEIGWWNLRCLGSMVTMGLTDTPLPSIFSTKSSLTGWAYMLFTNNKIPQMVSMPYKQWQNICANLAYFLCGNVKPNSLHYNFALHEFREQSHKIISYANTNMLKTSQWHRHRTQNNDKPNVQSNDCIRLDTGNSEKEVFCWTWTKWCAFIWHTCRQ